MLTTIIITIQGETHRNIGDKGPLRVKFDPPHKRWFEECMHMIKPNAVIPALFQNKEKVVVDGSFFPVKLHLVSAAWIIVIGQLKLMKGEFILSVYE